ncbi:MAG: YqeG family HAD IIIA-type phosphatase [Bacillota bacterium]
MFKSLMPAYYVDQLKDVPLAKLRDRGIKGLIIDLDNTITHWNSNNLNQDIFAWFKELKKFEFKPCLVSNNNHERVSKVAEQLKIPFVPSAGKPFRKAFFKGMEVLNTEAAETAVIGDQIFTDVLGGNRSRLLTILVMPLDRNEFIGTRFMRQLEKLVLKKVTKYEHSN